jgi:mannose-6-phosphate isomerase-like protein (cupin superfamily)
LGGLPVENPERRFVRPEDVETLLLPWGATKWLSRPGLTAAERFSVAVEVIAAGGEIPRHRHPDAEVVLYVVSGDAEATVGAESAPIGAGTAVFVPQGVYHSVANTGWEPLKLVVICAPPGLEGEMRESDDVRAIPPRRREGEP